MLEFEWDEDKAESNLQKHKVPFTEAATVFGDDLASTVYDSDHSEDEDRYITIGMSVTGRILIVSHTNRSSRIRIVSARAANRRERKDYEEGQQAEV